MNIKITSDSTCDLSPAQLAELDITLARLTIIKDGEAFLDGQTISLLTSLLMWPPAAICALPPLLM